MMLHSVINTCHRGSVPVLALLVALLGLAPASSRAQQEDVRRGAVVGTVQDADTGEPVGWVQLLLQGASRSTASDAGGSFELFNLRPSTYTLKTYRVGYEPMSRVVDVPSGDTLYLTLRLTSSPILSGEIVVEGRREQEQLAEADVAMEDRTLRQNLGGTIAETLDDEPGIAMRSMGPAPARPVLRGLGGERLLVLEDGGRTGDLSHTSSDHAVVIEPLTAERIEVVRGPGALVYGSNTLAGVVNVERGYVPGEQPGRVRARFSSQAASVSRALAGGGGVVVPVGAFALQADGSVRETRDVRTPLGELENTALTTYNGSAGASWVQPWGFAGAAGGYYHSEYGIPGTGGGVLEGVHPFGVRVEMQRRHYEVRGEYRPTSPVLRRIEARGTYSWYYHQEYEYSTVRDAFDVLGVEFGVLSYHGKLLAHTNGIGPFERGAVGVWGEYRDYASGGFVFTPRSTEWTLAGFAFQEADVGDVTIRAGLRYDGRSVRPEEEEESDIGEIRERRLGGFSAATSGTWHVQDTEVHVGVRLMRSLRMPGIEELYSQGPHLAAYTYEVGQPELQEEAGWGSELFARYDGLRYRGRAAVYLNYIQDFIFPRNTGKVNPRNRLPIYQYDGADARLVGAELTGQVQLSRRFDASINAGYTQGTLVVSERPLPEIPPLKGSLTLGYERTPFRLDVTARGAADQERVFVFAEPVVDGESEPLVPEPPTDGYLVFDASAQYHLVAGRLLHTFTLGVENAFDAVYRDHLSRVRQVMPEPGRNVKVLYRVYF